MAERVAVVTGAGRGLGREIARRLARRGIHVVLAARDSRQGEAARAAMAAEGLPVAFHRLDVRDLGGARVLAQWLEREYGRIDVLVNNAGILIDPRGARAATIDVGVVRETLETNLMGPLIVTQALLPLMRSAGYGRIVNLSSQLGQLEGMGAGTPAYRISKAALNALTRTLAAELQGSGIKVNAICPGWVRTDMGGPSAPRSAEEAAEDVVWLATLPDDGPSGALFKDRQPIPW